MVIPHKTQGTENPTLAVIQSQDAHVAAWMEQFLLDRKTQNLAQGTLDFYRKKLAYFLDFCDGQQIGWLGQLTPNDLRRFLLWLEEHGHNPGGVHACYRAVRAFLLWYEAECEPENWKNPIGRVKSPKVPKLQLDPADPGVITAMIDKCDAKTFVGVRDRALLRFLLDTGLRAQEALDVDLSDINLTSGRVQVRQGKGRKPRAVFMGETTRRAMRAWLKQRGNTSGPLWLTDDNQTRLTYWGLRTVVKRRALSVGADPPPLHAFRRLFALSMLRAGVDLRVLQELMGHSSLAVMEKYTKLVENDLVEAHRRGSPVDQLKVRGK